MDTHKSLCSMLTSKLGKLQGINSCHICICYINRQHGFAKNIFTTEKTQARQLGSLSVVWKGGRDEWSVPNGCQPVDVIAGERIFKCCHGSTVCHELIRAVKWISISSNAYSTDESAAKLPKAYGTYFEVQHDEHRWLSDTFFHDAAVHSLGNPRPRK